MDVQFRYDSNVQLVDRSQTGAPFMRLIGHLHLATQSAQRRTDAETGQVVDSKIQFRLKAAAGYREYFSSDDKIVEQRAVELEGGLAFKANLSRHFSFQVTDDFARSVTPINANEAAVGAPVTTRGVISRDVNRAAALLSLIPGGGRLTFDLGYALGLDVYEEDFLTKKNLLKHEISFLGKWRLLPKTAFFLQVSQEFQDYYNGDGSQQFVSGRPFRGYAGLSGLLTPRLSVLAKVGYGNGLFDTQPTHASQANFNSVLAKLEFGYQFTPTAQARVGYERAFDASIFGNYHADHHIYFGYDHAFISRFLLNLDLDYRRRTHQGTANESAALPDSVALDLLTVAVGLDWQIREWVYIGVGYDVSFRNVQDSVTTIPNFTLQNYIGNQFYFRLGVSY
ncbi:MAG: outer membrane beta-barrel protein [Deltaproteobacteria bacterium]|nr:outer membrane beta-barrel protein [Deltaproteobacteria bacterium]